MKYILPILLLSGPAFAHDGPHLHPHGSGGWLLSLVFLALLGGIFWAASRRK